MAKFKMGDACYYGSTPCVYLDKSHNLVRVVMGGTGFEYVDFDYLLKKAETVTDRHKEIARQYKTVVDNRVMSLAQELKSAKTLLKKITLLSKA